MSDSILASGDRKEGLSRAYVQAVAAAAGYTLAEQNFDRDGVDVQVRAGGEMRPSLDMQLKATVRLGQDGAYWRFPLSRLELIPFGRQRWSPGCPPCWISKRMKNRGSPLTEARDTVPWPWTNHPPALSSPPNSAP